ncbi:MAG: hypothetical protein RKO66_14160 [Candidatus Contendobacter sp.]|nr:hypothetical protein [Candidatus Contendobacter sp.]
MSDVGRVVDAQFFQAFVVLHRQNGEHAGFHTDNVKLAQLARTNPDHQIMTNNIPVQALAFHREASEKWISGAGRLRSQQVMPVLDGFCRSV